MKPPSPSAVRSTLTARSISGQRDKLLDAFFRRRILEECAEDVPGFLSAEVLVSRADPDEVQISVLWSDEGAWRTWQDSPVRLRQAQDLAHLLADAPQGQLIAVVRTHNAPGDGDHAAQS